MIEWIKRFLGSVRIGLEVGGNTIKMAWVVAGQNGDAEWRFLERARDDDTPETLLRQIEELLSPFRRCRFRARLNIAPPASCIREITLRARDAKSIPSVVNEELPGVLPFDRESAQVNFRVRRQESVDDQLDCRVSVAACELAPLQRYLEQLWQIGWAPSSMPPSALALVQTATTLGVIGQEAVVLLHIGESCTSIVLVDEGQVLYARDIALGDEHLTQALMDQVSLGQRVVSLSREEAKTLKLEAGIPGTSTAARETEGEDQDKGKSEARVGSKQIPLWAYQSMIQPILEQLVGELRRTMTFGAQTASAATRARLLLSGEGSRLPNCDRWLSNQLRIPVVRLDCKRFLGSEGSTAALVCGLALLERPTKLDLQPAYSRQRWWLACAAAGAWRGLVVLGILLMLVTAGWHIRHRAVAKELAILQKREQALRPVTELQDAIAWQAQFERRLLYAEGLDLEWFRKLAQDFPNPIRLTEFSVGLNRRVHMVGEVQPREQSPEAYVSQFVLWLEQSHMCEDVKLESSNRVAGQLKLVEFSVSCRLPVGGRE